MGTKDDEYDYLFKGKPLIHGWSYDSLCRCKWLIYLSHF